MGVDENYGAETDQGAMPEQGSMVQQPERYEDISAKVDILMDGFNELRQAMLAKQTLQQQPSQDDYEDDDEPVTGAKVNRIVKKAIGTAVSQSQTLTLRQQWDAKAQQEFPLNDPKFQRELRKDWKELVDSGFDTSHPKSLYMAAKITASKFLKESSKKESETSEAPTLKGGNQTPRTSKVSLVSEDDPRVRFYMMKGKKDQKRVDEFRAKLAEQDAKKGSRK